jgi:hypothetical protein
MDDKGVRYLMLDELVCIAGLDREATLLQFLHSVPRAKAHSYVANAVTGGVRRHLYGIFASTINATSIDDAAEVVSSSTLEGALPAVVHDIAPSDPVGIAKLHPPQPSSRPISRPSSIKRAPPVPGSNAFWRTLSLLCRFHQD